jgi:hypothetical protein
MTCCTHAEVILKIRDNLEHRIMITTAFCVAGLAPDSPWVVGQNSNNIVDDFSRASPVQCLLASAPRAERVF